MIMIDKVPDDKPTEELTLNQALVHEYLDYCETTGELTWKKNRKGKASFAGSKAGYYHQASGNVYITFMGVRFIASHIIFLHQTGKLPHRHSYIDGDRTNLRFDNLKEYTRKMIYYKLEEDNTHL
jgi:hypothetical protein